MADQRVDRRAKEARRQGQADWAGRVVFVLSVLAGTGYLWLWSPTTNYQGTVSQAIWDRAFTNGLLDLFRVGVVILGAFVAGGIAQRLWLGEFAIEASIFKLAPVVRSVERAAEDINEAVAKATRTLQTQTNDRFAELARIVAALTDSVANLQADAEASDKEKRVKSERGD
jgi:hypothetical protein